MIEKQVPGQLELEWPPRPWIDPKLPEPEDAAVKTEEIDEETSRDLGRVSIIE